jgi:hypothetical protein
MSAEAKRYNFIISGNIISESVFMELICVDEDWLRMGRYMTLILKTNLVEAGH